MDKPQGESAVPVHYVLSRTFDVDETEKLACIFEITPILGCIVTDARDTELALRIHPTVIPADDPEWRATNLFMQYGMPALIIGESEGLKAVYADGRREEIHI